MSVICITDEKNEISSVAPLSGILMEKDGEKTFFSAQDGGVFSTFLVNLCDVIFNIIRKKYLRKIISEEIKSADISAKVDMARIYNMLLDDEKGERIIKKELLPLLCDAGVFSVGGFVCFRMKEYRKYIKNRCKEAEEELLYEQTLLREGELIEFCASMREDVYILHLLTNDGNDYIFYDGKRRDVTFELSQEVEKFTHDIKEIDNDTIMFFILANTAPTALYVHNSDKLKKMVRRKLEILFGKRLKLCAGCDICKKI